MDPLDWDFLMQILYSTVSFPLLFSWTELSDHLPLSHAIYIAIHMPVLLPWSFSSLGKILIILIIQD